MKKKRKMAKNLILKFFIIFCIGRYIIASPIVETWLHATILIENEWGSKGTGFFVSRKVEGGLKILICTNKHVINEDDNLRENATKLIFHLNIESDQGEIIGTQVEFPLILPNGVKRWKEHPDDDVDVLVLDVTNMIINNPQIRFKHDDVDQFAYPDILEKKDITIGDDIFILGYPSGYSQGKTNYPIVRQGIIASQIGQIYIEKYKDDNGVEKERELRGFLIDGGLIPGSSGSPVILKPVIGRFVHGNISMGGIQPYLLGIVAETRFAIIPTVRGNILSYAGMGFAFDVSTIKETIDLFFK